MDIGNHYVVHCKYITILLVNHTSIKLGEGVRLILAGPQPHRVCRGGNVVGSFNDNFLNSMGSLNYFLSLPEARETPTQMSPASDLQSHTSSPRLGKRDKEGKSNLLNVTQKVR